MSNLKGFGRTAELIGALADFAISRGYSKTELAYAVCALRESAADGSAGNEALEAFLLWEAARAGGAS